jgi:sphingomyelin phosphodiesterase
MKATWIQIFILSAIAIITEQSGFEEFVEYKEFSDLKEKVVNLETTLTHKKASLEGFLNGFSNHTDSFICRACMKVYGEIYYLLTNYYSKTGGLQLARFLCHEIIGFSKEACSGFVDTYGPVLVTSLLDHYMTPEYKCRYKWICPNDHFISLNADDYAKEVLKDKPVNSTDPVIGNATRWNVLHVTDIHTDLLYKEGSRGECPDANCCRDSSLSGSVSDDKKAGKWGYVGKCDIPVRTLENFVNQAVKQQKPDFILWTGDNPSHSIWDNNNQEEIFNITSIFTNLLSGHNIPIYPCLGNHEKFPADQFFPFEDKDPQEKKLLQFFADLWRPLLGEDAYQEFLQYGFYSKKHLDTNLRIVSFNCLYCDVVNFYLIKDPTDPTGQIEWLENTLKLAESNNEVVYIIGHMPVGDTSILSECSKRIKAIVDRYSHIIRGIFGGHTHYDEVKVLSEYFDKDKITGLSFIAPSLTT